MATPNGQGGWDLTDEDAVEVIEAMSELQALALEFDLASRSIYISCSLAGAVVGSPWFAAALAEAWDKGYEQGAGEVRGEDEKPNPYRP